MIHRCAWCGKETSAEDGVAPVGAVSDGICEECRRRCFPGIPAGESHEKTFVLEETA